MPRCSTPSFICEVPLRAGLPELAVLGSRFEAARQLKNAILGESFKRLAKMRKDPGFEIAKAMPRGMTGPKATSLQKVQAKARQEAFKALRDRHAFSDFSLHRHPSLAEGCWLREHLDINTAQKVATRAFKSVDRWSFGQGGKPRFARYGEVESVEGKSDASGIRFRDGSVVWTGAHAALRLEAMFDPMDAAHIHAKAAVEAGKVKYTRILLRTIRGRLHAFAQLVLEGHPLRKAKHRISEAGVGLDLGPSQVAVVGEGHVQTIPFCQDLDRREAARRRYLRKLDRQRRANNPDNYRANGTVKPRSQRKPWQASKGQRATRAILAETLRVMAAQRKSLQGQVVNAVLTVGNRISTEKVDKRCWAKLWGRSVGHKAPGLFEASLGRKAISSGGSFDLFSTWTTFLSSRCLCGKREKKSLNNRKHQCGCAYVPVGTFVDRDEFSAFLALFSQEGLLDERKARESWTAWGVDILLHASTSIKQAANGEAWPPFRGGDPRQSGSQRSGSSVREVQGLPRGERSAEASLFLGAKAPPGTLAL